MLPAHAGGLHVRRHMERPPPPDTGTAFGHASEVEVERHFSLRKHHRVIISQDCAGRYRVHCDRWDTSDWEIVSYAGWRSEDRLATMTDTLENARKLASEHLSGVEKSERAYDI